jgi:predicted transcriptional regulator
MKTNKGRMRDKTFKLFRFTINNIINLRLSKLEVLLLLYISRNTSDNSELKFKPRVVSRLLSRDTKSINRARKSLLDKQLIVQEEKNVIVVTDKHGFEQIDYSLFALVINRNLNAVLSDNYPGRSSDNYLGRLI